MAKLTLTNAHITLGSDISGEGSEVSLDVNVDTPDATAFSTGGWRSHLAGLKQWSGSVTVRQDFAASDVDSIVWALLGSTATFAFRPTTSAVGASNPSYGGTVIIQSYQPIGQSVGDVAEGSISFIGSGALTRSTA